MKRETRNDLIVFCSLLAVSFGLRLYRINNSLWYDEIHTLNRFVLLPWGKVLTTLTVPNNHILYTLLAKLSISIFGIKEWSLRLPALIIGGVTPPVCFMVFRKRVKFSVAFIAGLFLLVSFWMVWFSQDARGYSAYILFGFLSQALYLDWITDKRRGTAAKYVVCSVVGCYFYFYIGFLLAAQMVFGFYLWLTRSKESRPALFILPIAAAAFSAALYLPGMMDLAGYVSREAHSAEGQWLDLNFVKEFLKMLASTRFLGFALVSAFLFALGLIRLWRQWPGFCLLNALAAGFILLFTWLDHVFIYPRFLAFLLPFYILPISAALDFLDGWLIKQLPLLKPHIVQRALALIVGVFMLVSLVKYYELGKQAFKQAADYIQIEYSGRNVISFGLASQEFLFYDPGAEPWRGEKPLDPAALSGSLVVASHPWSWSAENIGMLRHYCYLEKIWPSAGYAENDVYLFRCFGK